MSKAYEVEIKSLLSSQKDLDLLLQKLKTRDPSLKLISESHQLNHYFIGTFINGSISRLSNLITKVEAQELTELIEDCKSYSVRTRFSNGTVYLIVKGSLGKSSAIHGKNRAEFETIVNLDIEQLDNVLLQSGFIVQSKWSINRTKYSYLGIVVDLCFTPGYGFFAELEKVVHSPKEVKMAEQEIDKIMQELGLIELDQNKLDKMFDYYNKNWQKYYKTKKYFKLD
jgi:adenylate cyclase class IV